MTIQFYFVRHGETLFNKKGRMQGTADSPLTAAGIAQAEAARDALAEIFFDRIYVSPAERVMDTVDIIRHDPQRTKILDNLHEFDFGRFEGTRFTTHPDEIRAFFEAKDFSAVDGETGERINERIADTFAAIVRECEDGDRVLIGSHGMFARCLLETMLGVDIKAYEAECREKGENAIPNGSIFTFTYDKEGWHLQTMPARPEAFSDVPQEKTVHFYYVRHGETIFNQWNRMQGWCDSQLTANGISQASAASEALRFIHFERIYSSPSSRARKTAEIIRRYHECELVLDKGLKEVNFGDFDGIVTDSWKEEIFRRHITENWADVGGENREMIEKRITEFLHKAYTMAKDGQNILLVSHGTLYLNMLEILFDMDRGTYMEKRRSAGKAGMPNGGIFRFTCHNGEYMLDEVMISPQEFMMGL